MQARSGSSWRARILSGVAALASVGVLYACSSDADESQVAASPDASEGPDAPRETGDDGAADAPLVKETGSVADASDGATDSAHDGGDASGDGGTDGALDADADAGGDAQADSGGDVDAAPPPYADCTTGGPCQDLALDVSQLTGSILIETRDVATTSCSVAEGTIFAPGQRRLLRFTTFVTNVGTADLFLGDPASNSAAFEYATCHGHYHFKDYADYSLHGLDGSLTVQGHKESFCVEDNVQGSGRSLKSRAPQQVVGGPPIPDNWDQDTETDCSHPGLHVGWSDGYYNTTEGNWLDITGVATGDYLLTVTVDPLHTIDELDYSNNTATIQVHIPDPSADGAVCPATSDAIFRCTSNPNERSRCLKGVTTTQACPSGTTCAQVVEIAHPAICQ